MLAVLLTYFCPSYSVLTIVSIVGSDGKGYIVLKAATFVFIIFAAAVEHLAANPRSLFPPSV